MPHSYTSTAKWFHWLIVVMVAIQFTVGWIMPGVRRDMTPAGLVSFHMSFGIAILAVMILRLLWRFTHAVPPPASDTPPLQEWAARWVHYLLYGTLIILPITGWALASAHGWSVSLFGIVPLPSLVSASQNSEQLFDTLHVGTATIVAILIGAHILAGLYHYFILKDKVLQRMVSIK